jgi:hypothetical protein
VQRNGKFYDIIRLEEAMKTVSKYEGQLSVSRRLYDPKYDLILSLSDYEFFGKNKNNEIYAVRYEITKQEAIELLIILKYYDINIEVYR